MSTSNTHFCVHCRLRIRWFSHTKRWGRSGGELKYKFRCAARWEGEGHEPQEQDTP
jgi:hypothetical protein